MAANAGETKVKLWEGICYPENMRDDWQDEIDDILQVPFAYAVHDIDHDQKSKQRKTHAHVIVVWAGNTTRKAIINVLNRLSADGKKCCSSAEPINNIRHAYDYLIHDTASCRKKGKELYPVEARIEGNNFDIGQLEQLSTKDKLDMLFELVGFIMCEGFETINDFTAAALREFPEQYREIIVGYNSILERYCRGNYLNAERERKRGADNFLDRPGVSEPVPVLHRAEPPERPLDPSVPVVHEVPLEPGHEPLRRDAPPVTPVEELVLEPAEEALAGGVVGAAALGRHAPDQAAAVGVDERGGALRPRLERREKAGVGERLVRVPADRPADGHAVEAVHDGAEVDLRPGRQPELGDVGQPQAVGRRGPEVPPHEVGRGLGDLAGVGAVAPAAPARVDEAQALLAHRPPHPLLAAEDAAATQVGPVPPGGPQCVEQSGAKE